MCNKKAIFLCLKKKNQKTHKRVEVSVFKGYSNRVKVNVFKGYSILLICHSVCVNSSPGGLTQRKTKENACYFCHFSC